MATKGGKPRGIPMPGGFEDFDPTSRRTTRVSVSLPADVAVKVIAAARAMDRSVSWYLAELGRLDVLRSDGVPEWFETATIQQEQFPDDGEFAMTG